MYLILPRMERPTCSWRRMREMPLGVIDCMTCLDSHYHCRYSLFEVVSLLFADGPPPRGSRWHMSSIAHATDDPMSPVGRFLLGLCICRLILQIATKNALYMCKNSLALSKMRMQCQRRATSAEKISSYVSKRMCKRRKKCPVQGSNLRPAD